MLSPDEEDYLARLPSDQAANPVFIKPFDPVLIQIADEVIGQVRAWFPGIDVRHLGASALGISGQGDVDIYALAPESDFGKYLPGLQQLFGPLTDTGPGSAAWHFTRGDNKVSVYLTDPSSEGMQKQVRVYQILKDNPGLLAEYEKLKSDLNGVPYIDYQRAKYGFYHRILGD